MPKFSKLRMGLSSVAPLRVVSALAQTMQRLLCSSSLLSAVCRGQRFKCLSTLPEEFVGSKLWLLGIPTYFFSFCFLHSLLWCNFYCLFVCVYPRSSLIGSGPSTNDTVFFRVRPFPCKKFSACCCKVIFS